jgi:predicted transcriptional regulator YdeE
MQKIIAQLPAFTLIGITARTNNTTELTEHGKIVPCLRRYFDEQVFEKIPARKKPSTTFCVYTQYESDHTGDYTYFVGEEVTKTDDIPDGMELLVIPAQRYVKFTNGPGPMPAVVQEPWFKIWRMNEEELGGRRRYLADFEVYDERAANPLRTVVDIFIGIE